MATETEEHVNHAESIASESEQATSEAVEEVTETIREAEEEVIESAENVQTEVSEAHETLREAEQEIEQEVHETAHEAAQEVGEPQLAEQISEHLFRRLHDEGLLPHTQHHATSPVAETETITESPVNTIEEVPQEAEAVAADVAPEPQHWWFKGLRFRKR